MRTGLLALALITIVITGTRCEEAQAKPTPAESTSPEAEKLGKAILAALAADNYASFTDLFVTQHDYFTVYNSSNNPQDHIKADDSIAGMQEVHRNAKRSFDAVRRDGVKDGIVWDRTQYKSSAFIIDTVNEVELIRMKVVFTFRDIQYAFTATEVVKTSRGWKLMGRLAYGDHLYYKERRVQTEAQMEAMVQALVDSITKADSIAAAHMYRMADSTRIADSIAASQAKKKGKKKK